MRKLNIFTLLIVLLLVTAMLPGEEEKKNPWRNITENLLVYSDCEDNTYLLRSGDRGILFGAADPSVTQHLPDAGVKVISYIFLWNTRRDQVKALNEIRSACKELYGTYPKIGAPDSQSNINEPSQNMLLEKNREFWEIKAWRTVTGSVSSFPADMPMFTIKPDFYFRRRMNEKFLTATWGGYDIAFWKTASPHSYAHTFILTVDGKKVAISGRLLLNSGKLKKLTDFWASDSQDFELPSKQVTLAVNLLATEKVEIILPEIGKPMTMEEALSSLKLLLARVDVLSKLIPIQVRMDSVAYPGIQRVDLENDAYVINGGQGHYMVVNPGYPPALTEIPKLVGEAGKIDLVFTTDCRDIHNVSMPSLIEKYKSIAVSCPNTARIIANPTNYMFPRNSTRNIFARKIVKHGECIEWRGAKLYFYELPELPVAQQIMLMETPGSRVLFLGDALINQRMFPFYSPYFSPDLRRKSLEKVVKLISELKPTYIADDWGVREIKEPLDLSCALSWSERYKKLTHEIVWGEIPERQIDPFWVRTDPDAISVEWGKKVAIGVIVRNFSNKEVKMELSLSGEYLMEGKDWKKKISLGPQEILKVPVILSVRSDCTRSGTAVAIVVQEGKITSSPAQIILLEKKVIK